MKHQSDITRRRALQLGLGTLATPLASSAMADGRSPVLVELFTSQGCSSCPAADELAVRLVKDPRCHVLSFNVDYWDYLGWRDTLAKPEFSQRQYDYASARGDGSVFTPQMIFNGGAAAVGSDAAAAEREISLAAQTPKAVPISLAVTSKDVSVSIAAQDFSGEATLWLMAFQAKARQTIGRGENASKTITYVNAVRNLVPATMWKGEAYSGKWMTSALMPAGCTGLLAVLQLGKAGKVLGLSQASLAV